MKVRKRRRGVATVPRNHNPDIPYEKARQGAKRLRPRQRLFSREFCIQNPMARGFHAPQSDLSKRLRRRMKPGMQEKG